MGCSASKHHLGLDEPNVPLTRSMSSPGSNGKVGAGSPNRSSWKSNNREHGIGNPDACPGHSAGSQQRRSSSKLKPVTEEYLPDFVSSTKHPSNQGLDYTDTSFQRRKYAQSDRFVAFDHANEDNSERRATLLGRNAGNESRGKKLKPVDNAYARMDRRASSFRVIDSIDRNSGLRLLLSPAATPSRSFTSSTRGGAFDKTPSSTSGQFASCHNFDSPGVLIAESAYDCKVMPLPLERMGDSEEPGSPLFDPSILATFEKAVEASSDNHWKISEVLSSSSLRNGCLSLETCSDAESLDWPKESRVRPLVRSTEDNTGKVTSKDLYNSSNGLSRKKVSSLKVTPLHNDSWMKTDYLEAFDLKCPPGCEDKIVLYFTSLRGVRKTCEDCCTVRLILKGFGVYVDERDVWMHSSFRKEVTSVVGVVLPVPQLFVKGRYIGGVEDVKRLHEEGTLGLLLEGFPADLKGLCDVCGGVRFIPCMSCSGSCKVVSFREVKRCPDCNENGLMMCPLCYW